MKRVVALLLLLLLGSASACRGVPVVEARARFGAEYPQACAPPSPSLWPRDPAAARRATLVGDTVARARGDTLTILIRESQQITNRESTLLQQSTSAKGEIKELSGLPNAFRPGLPGGEVSSAREFKAGGQYDKDGKFEARVTAVVVDVQPNGNLVVEGARSVRLDDETKTIKISGIVRPFDVTPSNTVLSEDLAEASVSYEGDGPLTRNGKRGVLGSVVDFFFHHLWPF